MKKLSRVAIIGCGGTIGEVADDRLNLAWYSDAEIELEVGDLLARIPEAQGLAEIAEIPFRRISSQGLTDVDWIDLARLLQRSADDDLADGFVITHGTNALEETAYFLTLVLKVQRPVVVVGAMRPASGLSSDGDLNLVNAIRVAADEDAGSRGVLVVLNDTIHSARDVSKSATYRVNAFQDRDLGPLGFADADGLVAFYHRTERLHTLGTEFSADKLGGLPRVDIVVSHAGADGAMIRGAIQAGAKGIILAGSGAGTPSPGQEEALGEAGSQGVVVCRCGRVGSGRVAGRQSDLQKGIVAGDNLQPWKARVLLSLALTETRDAMRIQGMFDRY